MANSLVIVESPAKAKTISKFLGRNYTVKASVGHVRDLPRSQFGVDVEHGFKPRYITIRGKGEVLQELREAAKKADRVLLATDPDREGEAISWHLLEVLKLPTDRPCRIEFHEITKKAVQQALKNIRPLNENLIASYHGRRVLDRLVGYKLSPLLWNKVRKGLSAGRVQSVAARLICDREREIRDFVPQEYWTLTATLAPGEPAALVAHPRGSATAEPAVFAARLSQIGSQKADIPDEATALRIKAELERGTYVVSRVQKRERKRNPAPPFTTSTLQQEAARRLNFTARKTMTVAQQLYEGLDVGAEGTVGLITYIRTDSVRVAEEAQAEARRVIERRFGKEFLPEQPPQYPSKKGAQGAHEAIRPTSVERHPDDVKPYLTRDQYQLYRLIWERFVASQMAPAILDTVAADIACGEYTLRANGSRVKFPGFMVLYTEGRDEREEDPDVELPPLAEGDRLTLKGVEAKQHFTQPPPRYTEAMLIRTLEELGIGRPSTYAPIIETLRRRGYVKMEDKRFVPTELGFVVVDLLKESFPEIIDVEFTAQMEAKLDEVEEGKRSWTEVVEEFYIPFSQALERAYAEIEAVTIEDERTDEVCELCGRNMVIKTGRYGKFLACPGFPECRNTRPLLEEIGVACPSCGLPLVERRSRKGRTFYGCKGYPQCTFTSWKKPVNARCPKCGAIMVEERRRGQAPVWVCSEKGCDGAVTPPADGARPANGQARSNSSQGPADLLVTPGRSSGGKV